MTGEELAASLALIEEHQRAVAALREERAARLKAEAERDFFDAERIKVVVELDAALAERDIANDAMRAAQNAAEAAEASETEALALLSKAREAWARFAASDRLYHAYPCYHRVPVGGQTLPGAACTCGLADLAKILRTGETT